jgi:hypothetical protein
VVVGSRPTDLVIDLVQHVGNPRCQPGGPSQPHAPGEQCDQRHRAEDETALPNVTSSYSLLAVRAHPVATEARKVGVDQFGRKLRQAPDSESDEGDL